MCLVDGESLHITPQHMANPSDYAVKMTNRGGDPEDHQRPLSTLVLMTDTVPSWCASQRLPWLPRTQ